MRTFIFILSVICAFNLAGSNSNNLQSVKRVVKGQVAEAETNFPVSFATLNIVLQSDTTNSVALIACDVDGLFSIDLENDKKYIFKVSSIGKQPLKADVYIPSGSGEYILDKIYLEDDSQLLGEVVVAAQKPLVKTDIDKLVYSIEDDKDAGISSALDMMRKVPMITVDGDDNIQLQGSSNFLVYVNGKPSSLMSNNPSDVLKSLPANAIKNIEVITEPGVRYDAEGVSGVINIVTVQRTIDGYTGSVNGQASVLKEFGAGTYISVKAGKLGLTANYNYGNEMEPITEMSSERNDFTSDNNYLLKQSGTKYEHEKIHRGFLEATYEIDSLNLISVGANIFRKRQHEYSDYLVEMFSKQNELIYSYNRNSYNYPTFGTIEMNADYQHETLLKGEILTVSYRFSNEPNSDENRTSISPVMNFPASSIWDSNYAKTNEHTFQVDYVRPMGKSHELEMGAKYILRLSNSEIIRREQTDDSNAWTELSDEFTDFRHNQHIYALYLGDAFRWNKIGIKAGVRAEGTFQSIRYINEPGNQFSSKFTDIVPSISSSYSIADNQQIRIGYNMRIRRAGIDMLNPYVDETDPLNISFGNPELKSEKSNNININYGFFSSSFNINANLSHSFVNNSIESYTYMDSENPNVSITTYGNIGKRNETRLSTYINWMPAEWLKLFVNSGISYVSLESEANNLSNEGFSGRIFGGAQINMPKDFRINLNAGYIMPRIILQGYSASFMTHDITMSKDLFDRKLTVSLYCKSPLFRVWQQESKTETDSFVLTSCEGKVMRDFGLKISYRFGNMFDSIKKIKRGIVNDDIIE